MKYNQYRAYEEQTETKNTIFQERRFQKKEGITPIRCDTLTIHQERRYLSALHISKNQGKTTIFIQLLAKKIQKSAFLLREFCLFIGFYSK